MTTQADALRMAEALEIAEANACLDEGRIWVCIDPNQLDQAAAMLREYAEGMKWRSPDDVPIVNESGEAYFQIAVRRAHNHTVYSFPAKYCLGLPLACDHEPSEGSGNHWSQKIIPEGGDGDIWITGWYKVESHDDYDGYYTPALSKEDVLVGWRELPNWALTAALSGPSSDYPECSGDPMSCPENEGYGCCKSALSGREEGK